MTEDRRQYIRATLNLLISYETVEAFRSDYSDNISVGGVFIKTDRPLPVGTELKIHFMLPQEKEPLTAEGIVVHNTLDEEDAEIEGMGIEFNNVPDSLKKRITEIAGDTEQ